MNYYAAPMEGLTDRIWRQAHQRWFGAPEAPVRYYAPFLSPPENRVLIKKKMAELEPAANPGVQVIPQLLAKDGELAAWMIGELRRMGYTEVNLNFGCPSGTVTAKGKGSGMLRDPQKLDAFLDAVFSQAGGPVSVKTRLGVARAEEFGEILDVYNKYPLCGHWKRHSRNCLASWWAGASLQTLPFCARLWAALPLPGKNCTATMMNSITATPKPLGWPAVP